MDALLVETIEKVMLGFRGLPLNTEEDYLGAGEDLARNSNSESKKRYLNQLMDSIPNEPNAEKRRAAYHVLPRLILFSDGDYFSSDTALPEDIECANFLIKRIEAETSEDLKEKVLIHFGMILLPPEFDFSPILSIIKNGSPKLQIAAISAVQQKRIPVVENTILELLNVTTDKFVRQIAIASLGFCGSSRSLPVLEQHLTNPFGTTKYRARDSINFIKEYEDKSIGL